MSGTSEPASTLTQQLRDAWRACNVVCFDVDSTLSPDEGIDVLAAHAGVADAVAQLTRSAMSGSMSFETAIAARLALIQPTPAMIRGCLAAHPVRISAGAQRLVALLHAREVEVHLVSGGFEDFVLPIAAALGVPASRVTANKFLFAEQQVDATAAGAAAAPAIVCTGLDQAVPTCRGGGKAAAINAIKAARPATAPAAVVAMVGDGVTDLEAAPPADVFVGFGGVVVREAVRQRSKFFVHAFDELSALLVDG
jgi:phosphoserine phosphatase